MRAAVLLVGVILGTVPLALAENLYRNPAGDPAIPRIVALIDTGIAASHAEFATGQLVGWWDFTTPGAATGTFQTYPGPFDPHGHGTATASLVGGATLGATPGVRLAMAKVLANDGSISDADIVEALDWAVSVVGADVVSISLAATLPEVGAATELDEAVKRATDAGVLVVAAAGNGLFGGTANVLTETGYPASAPEAIAVGGSPRRGTGFDSATLVRSRYSNSDPDVVAWGDDVCVARAAGTTLATPAPPCNDAGYGLATGTSFATPLVAAWAGRVMTSALTNGQDATPARVKALLLSTAADHAFVPPTFEGRGFVNGFVSHPRYADWAGVPDTISAAVALAASGGPTSDPTAITGTAHGATVALRETSARTADRSAAWWSSPRANGVPLRLEVGGGAIRDAEAWTVTLTRGDLLRVAVTAGQAPPFTNDAKLIVFGPEAGTGPLYDLERALGWSENAPDGSGTDREVVAFPAPVAGTYTLFVEAVVARNPYGWGYGLSVTVNGAPTAPDYRGDEVHLRIEAPNAPSLA